jgi:hypothetical protein
MPADQLHPVRAASTAAVCLRGRYGPSPALLLLCIQSATPSACLCSSYEGACTTLQGFRNAGQHSSQLPLKVCWCDGVGRIAWWRLMFAACLIGCCSQSLQATFGPLQHTHRMQSDRTLDNWVVECTQLYMYVMLNFVVVQSLRWCCWVGAGLCVICNCAVVAIHKITCLRSFSWPRGQRTGISLLIENQVINSSDAAQHQ